VLALGHLALGESENALEAAENACKEDDRLYLPRLTLAAVHLVRKDQDSAVAAVKECVRPKWGRPLKGGSGCASLYIAVSLTGLHA
jgi:hypothetical protein